MFVSFSMFASDIIKAGTNLVPIKFTSGTFLTQVGLRENADGPKWFPTAQRGAVRSASRDWNLCCSLKSTLSSGGHTCRASHFPVVEAEHCHYVETQIRSTRSAGGKNSEPKHLPQSGIFLCEFIWIALLRVRTACCGTMVKTSFFALSSSAGGSSSRFVRGGVECGLETQGNIRDATFLKAWRGAELKAGGYFNYSVISRWNKNGDLWALDCFYSYRYCKQSEFKAFLKLPLVPVCSEQFPCGQLFWSLLFHTKTLFLWPFLCVHHPAKLTPTLVEKGKNFLFLEIFFYVFAAQHGAA